VTLFPILIFDLDYFIALQQAHRRANGGMPPPWAMVAIAILGFNEIMALLRYLPHYLQCLQWFLAQTENY
jgi:hypothetical protein